MKPEIKEFIDEWRRVSRLEETPERPGETFRDGWQLGINRVVNDLERLLDKVCSKTEVRCGNCGYYRKLYDEAKSGHCYRYPPKLDQDRFYQPEACEDEFCGEWKGKVGKTWTGYFDLARPMDEVCRRANSKFCKKCGEPECKLSKKKVVE